MFTRARLTIAASTLGALSVAAVSVGVPAASASQSSVAQKPVSGLLSASAAKKLGFPKTFSKPTSTSKTDQAGCPKAGTVSYEDSGATSGIQAEILVCNTPKAASTAISGLKSSITKISSQKPPKQLGSNALELSSGQSTYAIVWQRGKLVGLIAYDVDIAASSASTTTTTPTPTPLTSAQQATLSGASLAQDKNLK
jgi:hypothetical protein